MQTRIRAFNPQVLLESLCCGFFAGLLVYLIRSEKYLSYVTPRMKPYLYFSAVVMGIWALTGTLRLFQPQYKIRSMHCLVLAVPVVMFLLPHSPLEISDVTENFSRGSSMPTFTEAKPSSGPLSIRGTGAQETGDKSGIADLRKKESGALDTQVSSAAVDSSSLPGLDVQNKRITVSNEDFVEGTLSIGEYQYNDITLNEPQIHVTKITPTDPVEGYVYPFV